MNKQPARLGKVFGSGPVGLSISLVLFFIASWLNKQINPPPLSNNQSLLNLIFIISILMTLAVIVWSVKSLPASERGNKLCVTGAFKYVRHPLYAAFLSIFDFGLAIYLNSYIFILWAVLLHPICHYVVRYEERLMIDIFGEAYLDYQKKTGRFFPRLRCPNIFVKNRPL
ncbi:MAG: isoprenylcysteine carboxylmethyltransferase family protein [Candidatus Omnitrophica bacterium]|nr:isoprenylcysteine carboxylmethyltransferase family protein [Candidatus Omnitrophota bacterium]